MKRINVETWDEPTKGERRVLTETMEGQCWATAHGGDLLILDADSQPLAIYARGVWRRAYFPPETNP